VPSKKFDVLISGAGPAGAATALSLGNSGLRVALLDKAIFPRDKICGDALSVDVINQLEKLSPSLCSVFDKLSAKTDSHGVRIVAPGGLHIDIPFLIGGKEKAGYVCTRQSFDSLLMDEIIKLKRINVIQDCQVHDVIINSDEIVAVTSNGDFSAKILVGADGAQSVVRKKFITNKIDRRHYSAGLRVYYENVQDFQEGNYIELYFFREILPGYLWIFPLPEGRANVGLGMLSSVVSARKLNLQHVLSSLLASHPLLRPRFQNATPIESIKGFGLPLGSKENRISGDRFVLAGDAASLIDPFTGEGIGNAIRSGRVAADHILNCFQMGTYSATFNAAYDKEINTRMRKEFLISRSLQRLCRYPWLFNTVVRKANQNAFIHKALVDALAYPDKKKWLTKPSFYYHLLFKPTRS